MKGRVSLAALGGKEICWYHLYGKSILDLFFFVFFYKMMYTMNENLK